MSSNMTPSLFFLILRKLYFTFHLIIGERKAINGKYIGKQEYFLIKENDVEMTYLGTDIGTWRRLRHVPISFRIKRVNAV